MEESPNLTTMHRAMWKELPTSAVTLFDNNANKITYACSQFLMVNGRKGMLKSLRDRIEITDSGRKVSLVG